MQPSFALVLLLILSSASKASAAAAPLRIEVVRGQGAIHNVRDKEPLRPMIRVVRGEAGEPVTGASVTLRLPDSGPSASFSSGRILTLITNEQGEAVIAGAFRTNLQLGLWEMRVAASHQGETVRAVIPQTNAAPVEAFSGRGKASRQRVLLTMLAVGAAGAAVGAAGYGRGRNAAGIASTGNNATGAATAAPPLSITAGTGSVGAP